MSNPRILIISHIWPFPGTSGQEMRVRHMVEAAVRKFEVDFLTYASSAQNRELGKQLAALGCRPVILESCWPRMGLHRLKHSLASALFVLRTGLKPSNYAIGKVELSPARVRLAIDPEDYSAVLYEYFHAVDSVTLFQSAGVTAILDMHNVLWKSTEQRLSERMAWPSWFKQASVRRYRHREESAWNQFDALVAINRSEYDLVHSHLQSSQRLFYAPMGADLSLWLASWRPANPPRLAYYGSLGGRHNEFAARLCHDDIMPQIWKRFPDAELWLVGSNPPESLCRLTSDSRVKVTGFVEYVQDVLCTMSLVLCPWSGTYGFRSRIVEVMALGVPVVATPDAVDGMELESGRGIMLAGSADAMAEKALELLLVPQQLQVQSRLARTEMERLYSLENTYDRLMTDLRDWLDVRCSTARPGGNSPVNLVKGF